MCKIIFSDKQDQSTEVKEQSVLDDFYDCVFKQIWMCLHFCLIVHRFYTPDLSGRIMVWRWRLSVRLSVRPSVHKACKHDTDRAVSARTVKLGTHIPYDKRKNPIDFQGHGSKVKVTRYTLLLNLVNTIQTEPFQLGSSNLVHKLLNDKRTTPIDFQGHGSKVKVTHYTLLLNLVTRYRLNCFS